MDAETLLEVLVCPRCQHEDLSAEAREKEAHSIKVGLVSCRACASVYPIFNHLWYLIDSRLLPADIRDGFAEHLPPTDNVAEGMREQRTQIEFFAEDAIAYEELMTSSKFYRAVDELYIGDWINSIGGDALVLDVAGGTGRQAMHLLRAGNRVVCTDISREMLEILLEKAHRESLLDVLALVVADATYLPFADAVFDHATCVGALHHLPNPKSTVAQLSRVLNVGGRVFSRDPHDSPLRFVFDTAMRLWRLWEEEASDDPLLKRAEAEAWFSDAGFDAEVYVSTFILPHMAELLPFPIAKRLIGLTDRMARSVPYLNSLGGSITVTAGKVR